MNFFDRHAAERDRFAILTVHDPNGKTYAQVEKILAKLSSRTWRGRSLPFPILFDESATTIVDWGVRAYPTQVLIDPDGYVVASGESEEALRALEKGLESARQASKANKNGKAGS